MFSVILLVVSCIPVNEETWTTFAPKNAGMSVSFPGKPVIEREPENADGFGTGSAKLTKAPCEYLVIHSSIPGSWVKNHGKKFLSDSYMRPILAGGGKIVDDQQVGTGNNAVRQVLIEAKEEAREYGKPYWLRVYLRVLDERLLIVQVSSSKREEVDSAEAKRFLASFQLVTEKEKR